MSTNTDNATLVTVVLLVLAGFLLLPLLFMGFGLMGYGHVGGTMWGNGVMSDGAVSGWLLVAWIAMRVLFFVAILGGLYLVFRAIAGRERDTDPALEELRRAYARGELTEEEYETRRERLKQDH